MPVSSAAAERIVDETLSSYDGILSMSVRDEKGNILAAKSKESFKEAFDATELANNNYAGTLTVAVLAIVNEVKGIFGEAQTVITIHKDCKLVLLPMPSYEIVIGLVLERWVDADDGNIANNIKRIVAGTIAKVT